MPQSQVYKGFWVTNLTNEVKCDLQGHLEVGMASEVIDNKVIEITELNAEVRSDL